MRNIVLTGLSGSGKTTLGKIISRMLGVPFVDMDDRIVEIAGMPITEIFERHGEAYFRNLETLAAYRCAGMRGVVIATGGGVVTREENMVVLRQTGTIVYLERPADAIARDIRWDTRPLLAGGVDRLLALQRERDPLYRATADIVFPNRGTLQQAVVGLLEVGRRASRNTGDRIHA